MPNQCPEGQGHSEGDHPQARPVSLIERRMQDIGKSLKRTCPQPELEMCHEGERGQPSCPVASDPPSPLPLPPRSSGARLPPPIFMIQGLWAFHKEKFVDARKP